MRRLGSDQRGFSIIEVLVAMLLTTFVLGTTLTAFDALWKTHRFTEDTNEVQDRARTAIDRLARELRNLASPTDLASATSTLPRSVDRNLPKDLVFEEVADKYPVGTTSNLANVMRVRYCLDDSVPANGKIYRQTQTWTTAASPDMPATAACPAPTNAGDPGSWQTNTMVADRVTNYLNGSRPLFAYASDAGAVTGTTSDDRATITRLQMDLYLDLTAGRRPLETRISTGVELRNQNREPTASFTLTVLSDTQRQVQLNGSASEDPESQQLEYHWYANGTEIGDPKGTDAVLTWKAPADGTYNFQLKVKDPAGLESAAPIQTRKLPSTAP